MHNQHHKSTIAPDIAILNKALKRDKNLKVGVGFCLVFVAIIGILAIDGNFPIKTIYTISVILLLVGFTGLYFLAQGLLRYDTQRRFLLHILIQSPHEVAWVYYRKIESLPFGVSMLKLTTLFIFFNNREYMAIPMPETEILELMQTLPARLVNTVFGYTKQREQLYDISPDLLRQEHYP